MTDEVDMAQHIAPKTDQLNSDDLIAGPRTIVVTRVKETGNKEQPVNIFFEGDNGKPWKPCKSMRRVLTFVWGNRGSGYVGKSMTLFRDPAVLWAGKPVGGIRISHMEGLEKTITMALTANDKGRVQYEVLPLRVQQQQQQQQRAAPTLEGARTAIKDAADLAALERAWASPRMAEFKDQLQDDYDARKDTLASAAPAAQQGDDSYDGV